MKGYILIVLQIVITGLICFMFTETATESKYSLTGDCRTMRICEPVLPV